MRFILLLLILASTIQIAFTVGNKRGGFNIGVCNGEGNGNNIGDCNGNNNGDN